MDRARAAVFIEPGRMEIREFPLPEIGHDDGLLRIELAGVCASDAGRFFGKNVVKTRPPLILGHEILGRIERLGPGAAERWGVRAGDRVVVESTYPCNQCENCTQGRYNLCLVRSGYGNTSNLERPPALWGGYSQYMYLHPHSMIHPIADDIPGEAAVIIGAVLGNAFRWVGEVGGAGPGQTVVIQGCGSQGLAGLVAALELGAGCTIITGLARDTQRLQLARELGAHYTVNIEETDLAATVREVTNGRMADLVVELSGSTDAVAGALDLVKKGGRIVQAGLTGAKTLTPLPLDKLIFNEITLCGVFAHTRPGVQQAVRCVESRKYPLEKIVTHRFALDEIEQAFRATARLVPGVDVIKAVLDPHS